MRKCTWLLTVYNFTKNCHEERGKIMIILTHIVINIAFLFNAFGLIRLIKNLKAQYILSQIDPWLSWRWRFHQIFIHYLSKRIFSKVINVFVVPNSINCQINTYYNCKNTLKPKVELGHHNYVEKEAQARKKNHRDAYVT
jgi:hypothetical protein